MGTHSQLGGYNNPTAAVVGDGNQKRTQRQSDKTQDSNEQGRGCVYVAMPGELVQWVIEACETWPGGRTGELDGLVRMLGGRYDENEGANLKIRGAGVSMSCLLPFSDSSPA